MAMTEAIDIAHGAGIDKVGLMTAKVEAGNSMRKLTLIVAAAAWLVLGAGCAKLQSRDHLNKGVQSFTAAQYPQAVEHFKIAVDLDPNFPTARLYLATAYMQQWIPGAISPEN